MEELYISHLLEDEDMRQILEITGAGIESIDFSVSENLDRLNKHIGAYKKRVRTIGAKKLVLHGPFLDLNPMAFDSHILKVTRMRYEQAYAAARELGAKKIIYHTCFHPEIYFLTGWAERVSQFFLEFLEEKKDGIEIVMENVFDREWKPILEVAKKVNHPSFHLCLDVGHAHCYSKIPVTTWAKEMASHITHVHLHDNLADRDAHLALGSGSLPLAETLALLCRKDISYTIECNDKKAVLDSYLCLQRILEEKKKA